MISFNETCSDQINSGTKGFDTYCPLMGGYDKSYNYWSEKCAVRKTDRTQKDCFGGCNAKKKIERIRMNKKNAGSNPGIKTNMRERVYSYFKHGLTNEEVCKLADRAISTIRTYRVDYGAGR